MKNVNRFFECAKGKSAVKLKQKENYLQLSI